MLTRTLVCCGSLAAAFIVPVARAQNDGAAVAPIQSAGAAHGTVDTLSPRRFEIPARPLADALADFARQAGVSVIVEADSLPAARVAVLSGHMTPAEALRRLLDGTGLTARFADERTVVITGLQPAAAGTGAHALRRVVVRAVQTRPKQYSVRRTSSATRTDTPLLDTPQSVTVVSSELISDQGMQSFADVVRYVPGVTMGTGEGHRDQPTIRGNNTTADFFVDGVRDDAQYYRDLYNVDRVEALKGPNAMVFGRGGGGGVINRVLKEAGWTPTRELRLEGGAHSQRRATFDLGGGLGGTVAARLNAMAERSAGFRDAAELDRRAVNPTVAVALGAQTTLRAGYEYLRDERRVDRGIPSFQGVPAPTDITTFFGNPAFNHSRAAAGILGVMLEHGSFARFGIRNRLQLADYDKFYQNTLPGALNAAGTEVTLTAYSDGLRRRNVHNQTDVVYHAATGPLNHTLLFGTEFGRQRTDRRRLSGYFNDASTAITAPFESPTVATPVTFRPEGADPHSSSLAVTAAVYVQDQLAILPQLQLLLGLRSERFELRSDDHRTGEQLNRTDNLLSPRIGVVLKPLPQVSLYASHSISHLPSAGDQFTQLTPTTQSLEPERFTNREIGAKWEPTAVLVFSAAVYRLDRSNAAAPDPNEPGRLIQTGSQRSSGLELGISGNVTGAWQVAGGYASQRARITSTTTAAAAGAVVPLVPARTLTLWNRYDFTSGLGAGLGIVQQSELFAGVDNKVRLPSFTRVDAALYARLPRHLRAQANVENLLDRRYYPSAHNNNNIMPGAPRTVRFALLTDF